MALPAPNCTWGYTGDQIEEIFGPEGSQRRDAFSRWMSGQTRTLCEGRTPECGGVAHGGITYTWDVERYAVPEHKDRWVWD